MIGLSIFIYFFLGKYASAQCSQDNDFKNDICMCFPSNTACPTTYHELILRLRDHVYGNGTEEFNQSLSISYPVSGSDVSVYSAGHWFFYSCYNEQWEECEKIAREFYSANNIAVGPSADANVLQQLALKGTDLQANFTKFLIPLFQSEYDKNNNKDSLTGESLSKDSPEYKHVGQIKFSADFKNSDGTYTFLTLTPAEFAEKNNAFVLKDVFNDFVVTNSPTQPTHYPTYSPTLAPVPTPSPTQPPVPYEFDASCLPYWDGCDTTISNWVKWNIKSIGSNQLDMSLWLNDYEYGQLLNNYFEEKSYDEIDNPYNNKDYLQNILASVSGGAWLTNVFKFCKNSNDMQAILDDYTYQQKNLSAKYNISVDHEHSTFNKPHATGYGHATALQWAVYHYSQKGWGTLYRFIETLIKLGASVNGLAYQSNMPQSANCCNKMSAIDIALAHDQFRLINDLMDKNIYTGGPNADSNTRVCNPFWSDCQVTNYDWAIWAATQDSSMSSLGRITNVADYTKNSAGYWLYRSCFEANWTEVKSILNANIFYGKVSVEHDRADWASCLQFVAFHGTNDFGIVEMLLEYGADRSRDSQIWPLNMHGTASSIAMHYNRSELGEFIDNWTLSPTQAPSSPTLMPTSIPTPMPTEESNNNPLIIGISVSVAFIVALIVLSRYYRRVAEVKPRKIASVMRPAPIFHN